MPIRTRQIVAPDRNLLIGRENRRCCALQMGREVRSFPDAGVLAPIHWRQKGDVAMYAIMLVRRLSESQR